MSKSKRNGLSASDRRWSEWQDDIRLQRQRRKKRLPSRRPLTSGRLVPVNEEKDI